MKYFYLKNGDVFGPLEPKQIVAELGDIADTLVCPEAHAADQDYWKDSSEYDTDFGAFLNKEEDISSVHKTMTEDIPAVSKEEVLPSAANAEEPIFTAPAAEAKKAKPSAVIVTHDTPVSDHTTPPEDIDVPLTELIQTPADTVADLEPQTDEHEGTLFIPKAKVADAKPIVVGQEHAKEDHAAVEREPLTKTETVPSGVDLLPIEQIAEPAVNMEHKPGESFKEEDNSKEEDLPHGIEETFSTAKTVRILVDEIKETPQIIDKAAVADDAKPHYEGDKPKEKSFFSAMKDEQPAPEEQVEVTETADSAFPFADENAMITDDDINTDPFLEIENKLINEEEKEARATGSQKNTQTSEKIFDSDVPTVNGKIINSYEAPAEPQKPRNDVLIILIAFMAFFVIVALFMTKFMDSGKDKTTPAEAAAEVTETKAAENTPLPIVTGDDISAQPSAAVPIPAALENRQGTLIEKANEDSKIKAQNIVKRYLLNEAKGTIGEYFDKLYGAEYQTRWSSTPLVSETYVVEFVASKVRKEPIVYLFRVDLKKGVVTGGLNNITLDLLQN